MPLIVTGGDGALYHELQKLRVPFPEVVILPTGRGNALARDLRRLPAPATIDLMEVEVIPDCGAPYKRLCGSSVSFGYATQVTRQAERFRPLRRLSYAAGSVVTWPQMLTFHIGYEGGALEARRLTGVLINNTRHVGGFVGFPEASCTDGLADVMETRSGYASQMLHNVSSMLRLHVWRPARRFQAREAEVHAPVPRELMLDGELVSGIVAIRVKMLPGALVCRAL
ncbi:hypothetical protein [uncultured Paludibaculum sp.]|uniref:diacylglycerol/lipid kinase family protein n=1 Tax=uncultured Paludibaculum sp. TaxID=1765020 RepID=UPI002AABECF7|nr:hypothetical protein [uncultured Paludibaculum sp.]